MEENPAGDQEEYLKKLDYQEYAAGYRIQLLEVLISRGLYSQAMSVIEESGYEGIRPESLLRLTSRMLTKCEMAEDEELLALASDVYRMGKYDEVILKYLMDYRFGPLDELLSVWKSAHGFDMDTYELEEKLLGLLMFTSDYRKEGGENPGGLCKACWQRISDWCLPDTDCLWRVCAGISYEYFCAQ